MKINQPVTQHEYELPDGATIISRTNKKGVISWCNDLFAEVSGFAREELIKQNHNIVRHPDMPTLIFADLWRTLQAGRSWTGIVKNRRKNGDFYWVRAMVTPVPDGSGYTSVRIKPTRQDIQNAESLYRRIHAGEKITLREGKVVQHSVSNFINRVSLSTRLWWMVGLPIVLTIVLIVTGLLALNQTAGSLRSVYEDRLLPINRLNKINDLSQMSLIDLMIALHEGDKTRANPYLQDIQQHKLAIDQLWKEYSQTQHSPTETTLAADHDAKRTAMWAVLLKATDKVSVGEFDQAENIIKQELIPIRPIQEQSIDALINFHTQYAEKEYRQATSLYADTQLDDVLLGVLGSVIAIGLAALTIRHIRRYLQSIVKETHAIATGDLTHDMPISNHDELGDLVSEIAIMRNSLLELIASVKQSATTVRQSSERVVQSARCSMLAIEAQGVESFGVAAAVKQLTASIQQVEHNAGEALNISHTSSQQSGVSNGLENFPQKSVE
jgi:PAS domain S-box-containing protein